MDTQNLKAPVFIEESLFQQLLENKYKVIASLGEGVNGRVYLVEKISPEKKENIEKYAVKIFEYSFNSFDMENSMVLSDIHYSLSLKHPYICRSVEFLKMTDYFGIVMEYADMELRMYLDERKLGYIEKIKFMYQLAAALECMNSLGLIHGDLKPNNILIRKNNILLGDFGMIRIKEIVDPDFCQSYPYRPAEFILRDNPIYCKLFSKENRIKWVHNQINAEMWSFGLICLDIIYNKPFLTWFGNKESQCECGYDILLDKLLENPKNPYDVFVSHFGEPENPDLLRVIVDMFLNLNQDLRIRSYQEFLGHGIFELIHIPELIHLPQMPILSSFTEIIIEKENVYTPNMLKITIEWMFEVGECFELPPYIVFNAVDFFLQKINKYIDTKNKIQLFACTCLWLMSRLNLNIDKQLYDYILICDRIYDIEDFSSQILTILEGEKGKFVFDSVYKYLPTRGSLYYAKDMMCNVFEYAKLGPSNAGLHILGNMDEIDDKFLKVYFTKYKNKK